MKARVLLLVSVFHSLKFTDSGLVKRSIRSRDQVPPPEVNSEGCQCEWTPWMNNKDYSLDGGDDNSFENLRRWHNFCLNPQNIKCREKYNWAIPFHILQTGGAVCNVTSGLQCVSRPYKSSMIANQEKPFYCDDYEITVQCCTCPTTTPAPITTAPTTVDSTTGEILTTVVPEVATYPAPAEMKDAYIEDLHFNIEERNTTGGEASSGDDLPITVILISVFGVIVIIAFVIIIWILLSKADRRKTRIPQDECYKAQSPVPIYKQIDESQKTAKENKITFARTPSSQRSGTSDFMTSSDDEGYRSRTRYQRKRKTKGERDRKLNGSRSNDSYGNLQCLDVQGTTTESSDEGRLRRWFPDEYERSLQQKRPSTGKTKTLFSAPFSATNRKSIPYMDGLDP